MNEFVLSINPVFFFLHLPFLLTAVERSLNQRALAEREEKLSFSKEMTSNKSVHTMITSKRTKTKSPQSLMEIFY